MGSEASGGSTGQPQQSGFQILREGVVQKLAILLTSQINSEVILVI